MKKIVITAVIALMCVMCGCKYSDVSNCSDRPVEPDNKSYEKGDAGDPQLPYMKPWWK